MSGKRKHHAASAPHPKRRKAGPALEQISFNPADREEYLTGFHKRKVQRINQAKESAAKKERQDKLAARKQLREERKMNLEAHIKAVNSALQGPGDDTNDGEDLEDQSPGEGESWNGFQNDAAIIDHENEYVDEDRFTTVTVEAVDVDKDGLRPAIAAPSEGSSEGVQPVLSQKSRRTVGTDVQKRSITIRDQKDHAKRKKKFRYESKAERKATRFKERMGNRAKAKARKTH